MFEGIVYCPKCGRSVFIEVNDHSGIDEVECDDCRSIFSYQYETTS